MAYDVSVIVPIYNMEKHVSDGVAALKRQTCPNMQVILVNDGSTDNSESAAKSAIEGLDNFTLLTTENRGSGPARNAGIARAEGKYLYFFDIDDKLYDNSLERMVKLAEESACDLLVFSFTHTKDFDLPAKTYQINDAEADGDHMRAHFENYMSGGANATGAPWNKLFRRDVVKDNNVEYPPLRRHQDEGFIMRYISYARKVRFSSEVLYRHLGNTQSRRWQKYPLDYGSVVEGLMDMFEGIVINWNPDNDAVRKNVYQIYYERNIDVLKVLFNPKWGLSHSERYKKLKDRQKVYEARAEKYRMLEINRDNYFSLIKGRHYLLLYLAVCFRVNANGRSGK